MGAALPVAALVASVAGPIVKGIGENKELRAGARVDEQNGLLSLQSGQQDILQIGRDARQADGDVLTEGGASGLIGGSISDILANSAMMRERDIDTRRKQARGENDNYQQAAADKRKAGRMALIGGAFGAASAALSGASAMRSARLGAAQAGKERTARAGG